jgi:predicted peroxiredoxin
MLIKNKQKLDNLLADLSKLISDKKAELFELNKKITLDTKFKIGCVTNNGFELLDSVLRMCKNNGIKLKSCYINLIFMINVSDMIKVKNYVNNDYKNCDNIWQRKTSCC